VVRCHISSSANPYPARCANDGPMTIQFLDSNSFMVHSVALRIIVNGMVFQSIVINRTMA